MGYETTNVDWYLSELTTYLYLKCIYILLEESNINFPMSDELLLCFIRARKYDLHRASKMVFKCNNK